MSIQKLTSTNAFVVHDLPEAPISLGLVRCAPKLLASSTEELARSASYMLALAELPWSGAAASINATEADRAAAVEAFVAEVAPLVSEGKLQLAAGKGVTEADLAPLRGAAGGNPSTAGLAEILYSEFQGLSFQEYLRGVSAAAAVIAALATGATDPTQADLTGKTVAIDGLDATGLASALELSQAGAKIVALSTTAGWVAKPEGFDVAELQAAYLEHGDQLIDQLGEPPPANSQIFEVPCDALLAGSKMGVTDHHVAELVQARVLGSLQPLAFTTRGMVTLQNKGCQALPGFLCLGGPLYAATESSQNSAPSEPDHQSVIKLARTKTAELVTKLAQHPEGLFLAACYQAEEFLLTWRDELPFGRPLAP